MHLALRMGRTLAELGQSMSAAEFELWLALHRQEPIDDSPGYLQSAQVCATLSNWAGMTRKPGAPAASIKDYFLPELMREAQEEEVEIDPMEYFRNVKGTKG